MLATVLIFVIAIPLGIAALTAFAGRRLGWPPPACWAVALAFAFVAGQVGLKAQAGWHVALDSLTHPSDARDWLPWIVLLAAGISVLHASLTVAWRWSAYLLALFLVVAAPLRLLADNVRVTQDWSHTQQLGGIATIAFALSFVWAMLAVARGEEVPLLRVLLMGIAALGAAVVITLSGVIVNGQLSAVLAFALVGAVIGSWLHAWPTDSSHWSFGLSGVGGVTAMSVGGLILLAMFYAELSTLNALLILFALLSAGGPLPSFLGAPTWVEIALRVPLVALPLAYAVHSLLQPATNPYG